MIDTMKTKIKKPRVLVKFNTGSRIMLSKRDKSIDRKTLKKQLRDELLERD